MVPKALRDLVGLRPGPVEVTSDGASLRIEPVADGTLVEEAGRTVIPATGTPITDAAVRDAMEAGRR